MTYFVRGGIYTGTDFTTLEPDTAESHGPFTTYAEALEAWNGAAMAKIDTCCHRLVIEPEDKS